MTDISAQTGKPTSSLNSVFPLVLPSKPVYIDYHGRISLNPSVGVSKHKGITPKLWTCAKVHRNPERIWQLKKLVYYCGT